MEHRKLYSVLCGDLKEKEVQKRGHICMIQSCSVMSSCLQPRRLYSPPRNSPGQNTGVGSLSLLQGIFLTQGLNPGHPPCRQILYQLSYQGSFTIYYNYFLSTYIKIFSWSFNVKLPRINKMNMQRSRRIQ